MIAVTASIDLQRFNSVFARYMDATSKLPDEVLEKKGRDLGIQLFNQFKARKWGGKGKHPGIAKAGLLARTKAGKGTKVRASLMEEYLSARTALRSNLAQFVGPKNAKGQLKDIKKKVSLWQSFVGKETGLRQHGIGVLAASFLWFRSRSSNARGRYYTANRGGLHLGFAEKGDGFFRVVSDTDGAAKVDSKYGLVDSAVATLTVDMLDYFKKRHADIYQQVFSEAMAIK
jgi:hypothetical protein